MLSDIPLNTITPQTSPSNEAYEIDSQVGACEDGLVGSASTLARSAEARRTTFIAVVLVLRSLKNGMKKEERVHHTLCMREKGIPSPRVSKSHMLLSLNVLFFVLTTVYRLNRSLRGTVVTFFFGHIVAKTVPFQEILSHSMKHYVGMADLLDKI